MIYNKVTTNVVFWLLKSIGGHLLTILCSARINNLALSPLLCLSACKVVSVHEKLGYS